MYDKRFVDCETESCVRFCCYENGDDCMYNITGLNGTQNLPSNFTIINGEKCEHQSQSQEYAFDKRGRIYEVEDNETFYDWHLYCYEPYFENGEDETRVLFCKVFQANVEITEHFPYFMLISVPFLFVVLITYGSIAELRNLAGKCLICYVFSLIVLYSVFSLVKIFHTELVEVHLKPLCLLSGYTHLASCLMCFLWLNVLCYDVWSTIRKVQNVEDNAKTFIFYCLYAFGAPIVYVLIIFLLHQNDVIPKEYRLPLGPEKNMCLIGGSEENEKYYLIPIMVVVLIINIIFYTLTAWQIYIVQKKTSHLFEKENSRHSQSKFRFFLYVRLFVMMGIGWLADMLSWFLPNSSILTVLCLVNCIQGFFIFINFVSRKRVEMLMMKKFKQNFYEQNSGRPFLDSKLSSKSTPTLDTEC